MAWFYTIHIERPQTDYTPLQTRSVERDTRFNAITGLLGVFNSYS